MGWAPQVRQHRRSGRRPWYTLHTGGREHHLGTDAAAAHRRAGELLAAEGVQRVAPLTVAELSSLWIAAHGRIDSDLGYWVAFDGFLELADLSSDRLQAFSDWLARQRPARVVRRKTGKAKLAPAPLSRWTIRHYVCYARAAWKWGIANGWVSTEPGRVTTREPPWVPRDYDPSSLAKALTALPKRIRPLIQFIASTGCRPKEARLLAWDVVDVNRHSGVIPVAEHKTSHLGRIRKLYLTPPAIAVLDSQPRAGVWVFPSRTGKPYTAGGLRSILRRRGISSVYALRHTFAQWFLEHGGDDGGPGRMEDLQELLGHSRITTTQVYARVRQQRARNVASRLKGPIAQ